MTSTALDLKPSRSEPVFWIRRIVILQQLDPFEKVNDISFKRGLNIVFGEEKGSPQDIKASGHGVGKTSLCRLIRYCLGEPHFGRRRVVSAIRQDFPSGWVGAELNVNGQAWAVLRPFAIGPWSRAARDMTVEDLALQRQQAVPYSDFETALASALMTSMPRQGQVVPGVKLTHSHLLPAFTRDQECRLESVWKWRSERSDSEAPSLPRPKIDGSRVIRAILGVLDTEELALQDQLDGISIEADKIRGQIETRLSEPRYWVARLNQALLDQGLPEIAQDAGELFTPANRVSSFVVGLRDDLRQLEVALEADNRELRGLLARIERREADRRELVALQGLQAKRGNAAAQYTQDERDVMAKLKALQSGLQMCNYGGIPFRDCGHIDDHLGRLEGSRDVALPVIAQSDQATARFAADIAAIDQELAEPRARVQVIEKRIAERSANQRSLERRIEAIERLSRELDHYVGLVSGTEQDADLAKLRNDLALSEENRAGIAIKVQSVRSRTTKQFDRVRRLFSVVVGAAVSPDYSGEIIVTEEEIEFEIRRKAAIGGEAVESLAVVLADACGLLASVEGAANHPGFVLHDSPREADLGSALYHRYISFMLDRHNALGGNDLAPFQYIMTTTTPPPPECGVVIRVHLSDDDDAQLLFKRRLGSMPSGLL